MRLVIQRVKEASVLVNGAVVGQIGRGALVFLGIRSTDRPDDTVWLVQKLLNLRLFSDAKGKMNLSLQETKGELLIVSQFTLYAHCYKGCRPDFKEAAPARIAKIIYEKFVEELQEQRGKVETGAFGASMEVRLINDGPVTLIIDTPIEKEKGQKI